MEINSQARSDVFDDIECFYNPMRRHSTLGYLSPVQFEQVKKVRSVSMEPAAAQWQVFHFRLESAESKRGVLTIGNHP